jgi:hypothetical protein
LVEGDVQFTAALMCCYLAALNTTALSAMGPAELMQGTQEMYTSHCMNASETTCALGVA